MGNYKKIKISLGIVVTISILAATNLYLEAADKKAILAKSTNLKKQFNHYLFQENIIKKKLSYKDNVYTVKTTIDNDLTNYIKKRIKRYRPDYASIVVIDNNTGNIISAVGYGRKENAFNYMLPFSSTHPSASIIKIITTADLLNKDGVDEDTLFSYRGRGTTLYKYQLRDKKTRWTRKISLAKAFAFSNNVIFGKAAIQKSTSGSIVKMAHNFGFNKRIMSDIDLSASSFNFPENQYNLAELASGFNSETQVSPIHAAAIASVVANDGKWITPKLIDRISGPRGPATIIKNKIESTQAIDKLTARKIKNMMKLTVKSGTARGSFRGLKKSFRSSYNIGGKTGTITGGAPRGKHDWFVGFAVPKENNSLDKMNISIAVLNINIDKWYVKSSLLARNILEYYYRKSNAKKMTFNKTKKLKDKDKV